MEKMIKEDLKKIFAFYIAKIVLEVILNFLSALLSTESWSALIKSTLTDFSIHSSPLMYKWVEKQESIGDKTCTSLVINDLVLFMRIHELINVSRQIRIIEPW